MRKAPTAWANLFGVGFLGIGDDIYSRYGSKFTETSCTKHGPWFGKFARDSKLRMVMINKKYFRVTSKFIKALFVVWGTECKM